MFHSSNPMLPRKQEKDKNTLYIFSQKDYNEKGFVTDTDHARRGQ